MDKHLKTNIEKLFPPKDEEDEDDLDDLYSVKKDVCAWNLPDFKLEQLLYSEITEMDSMDGINYGVVRRNNFIKALENLHFEYTKNHEDFQIKLVITE